VNILNKNMKPIKTFKQFESYSENKINLNYDRVLPRDLFNEAKLLKCVGRLCLLIHDDKAPDGVKFEHNSDAFEIGMTTDGDLTISNIKFFINDKEIMFVTRYNNKANYPFFVQDEEYLDHRVFDEQGNLDNEFIQFCKTI
jgi:hypothetical protein